MKKYPLSMMIVMAFVIYVFAEPARMSIAVLELDANGVARNEARALTDRLRAELFTIGKFDVMERDKMVAILSEQQLLAAGIDSARSVIEIGRIIRVNGIVSGSIGKLGSKYLLNARLVDVETSMILATATEECACPPEELITAVDKVAQRLAGVEKRAEFTIRYYDKSAVARGNFYIKSVPAGATVYINDKMIRNVVTPLTIEDLPVGNYKITAEKEKYSKSLDVSLQNNEFRKIDLVMEKKQGSLDISANIPQSDV
jgi:TolB-like protein